MTYQTEALRPHGGTCFGVITSIFLKTHLGQHKNYQVRAEVSLLDHTFDRNYSLHPTRNQGFMAHLIYHLSALLINFVQNRPQMCTDRSDSFD